MQNPPKRWEIFTSKKICEGVYGFTKIFRWSCWKNDGGDIDLEVPARELEGIKRAFYWKWKRRKRKKREVREWAGQRDEKMSDCVVGSGVRWGLARGNPKQISDLDSFFFIFYFILLLTGMLHAVSGGFFILFLSKAVALLPSLFSRKQFLFLIFWVYIM